MYHHLWLSKQIHEMLGTFFRGNNFDNYLFVCDICLEKDDRLTLILVTGVLHD